MNEKTLHALEQGKQINQIINTVDSLVKANNKGSRVEHNLKGALPYLREASKEQDAVIGFFLRQEQS